MEAIKIEGDWKYQFSDRRNRLTIFENTELRKRAFSLDCSNCNLVFNESGLWIYSNVLRIHLTANNSLQRHKLKNIYVKVAGSLSDWDEYLAQLT